MVDEITDKWIHYENMRPGRRRKTFLFLMAEWWEWKKKEDRYNNQDKFDGRAYSYFFFEWGKEKFIVAR